MKSYILKIRLRTRKVLAFSRESKQRQEITETSEKTCILQIF